MRKAKEAEIERELIMKKVNRRGTLKMPNSPVIQMETASGEQIFEKFGIQTLSVKA